MKLKFLVSICFCFSLSQALTLVADSRDCLNGYASLAVIRELAPCLNETVLYLHRGLICSYFPLMDLDVCGIAVHRSQPKFLCVSSAMTCIESVSENLTLSTTRRLLSSMTNTTPITTEMIENVTSVLPTTTSCPLYCPPCPVCQLSSSSSTTASTSSTPQTRQKLRHYHWVEQLSWKK